MKDYIDLPASLSLNITGGTTGPQASFLGKYPIGVGSIVSTDVDGDGRDELVAFNPTFNTFGIVSYFNYADLSNGANVTTGWSNATNDQLITTYLAQNELSGVPLDPSAVTGLGDFDGDGQEEIFVFSTASLTFSLFKWNTTNNVLEQVYFTSASMAGIQFNSTLQFFAADIDGDGADELMVFSQSTYWLFPVEWSSSTTNGVTTFTPGMGWYPPEGIAANYPQVSTINTLSRFYVGDFDGDGAEELFVFTPVSQTYYILKWAVPGQGIPAQFYAVLSGSGTLAGVTLQDPDRFYPVDIDGDGQDELAVLYPNTSGGNSQFWIFDFTVSSPLALTPNLIWNPQAGWAATGVGINPSDQFYFGDFDGDDTQEIVMYSAVDNWFFLLEWNSQTSTLSSAYASQTFIPTNVDIGLVVNVATNTFFSLDLDGDGTDELVLFNVMTQSMELLGNTIPITQASANLSILRYENNAFTSTWQTTSQVPAWNIDMVLSGPSVPFSSVAFTGTQLPVYQYISNLFLPQSDGDIRSYYVNLNLTSGNWSTWAALLQTMSNPPGQGFSNSDWTAVAAILVNEFSAIGPVVAMTNNAVGTLPIIQNQQSTDLSNVIDNIGVPAGNTTVTPSWGNAIEWLALGASTYASATLPPGQGTAITVAMTVTVALLLELAEEENTAPVQVSYSNLVGTLAENFVEATQANVEIQQSVLVDAVKLPVIGQLAMGAWSWNSGTIVEVITSPTVAAADRVGFYQQILPAVCQINWQWSNSNYTNDVPPWAQYVVVNPFTAYDYTIYWISFVNDEDAAPNQACLSDLFYTCGVSQADLFLGTGPWANIPRKPQNA